MAAAGAYRDPAPAPPEDAELALIAEYFAYNRRGRVAGVLLYVTGALVAFPYLYLLLAELLARRQQVSWPYGVAVTAAALTMAMLFALHTALRAAVVGPLRRRWIRAAAARRQVDPQSIEDMIG